MLPGVCDPGPRGLWFLLLDQVFLTRLEILAENVLIDKY